MNHNPIIIIDDDEDDLELIQQAFEELQFDNEIIIFRDGRLFLEYIKNAGKILFILCDINMHPINGLELKRIVNEDEVLRLRCVPFIFLSTSAATASVFKAYSTGVQGYFIKPPSFQAMKDMIMKMVNYWSDSHHPNI